RTNVAASLARACVRVDVDLVGLRPGLRVPDGRSAVGGWSAERDEVVGLCIGSRARRAVSLALAGLEFARLPDPRDVLRVAHELRSPRLARRRSRGAPVLCGWLQVDADAALGGELACEVPLLVEDEVQVRRGDSFAVDAGSRFHGCDGEHGVPV